MTDGLLYRVIEPFVIYGPDGERETYNVGNRVYAADHPAVVKRPESFTVVTPVGGVETATAAPGEARAVKPPRSQGSQGNKAGE